MKTLINLLSLFPTILRAVISVEAIVTGAKSGATKKQLVLASIEAAKPVLADTGEVLDNRTLSAVPAVIDGIVGTLNAAGVFGK